MKTKKRLDWD